MRLYEREAKLLLRDAGVPTPRSWSRDDDAVELPVMVKAQLLEGGRGKRGGIIEASTKADLDAAVEQLLAGSDTLPPAHEVLVEELVAVEQELYVSFIVDRSAAGVQLLVSPAGGIEVEDSAMTRAYPVPIDAVDVRGVVAGAVSESLDLQAPTADAVIAAARAMWQVLREHECELVEVNPLGVLADGSVVALDARVAVDERARFRHPDQRSPVFDGTFEGRCAELGVFGVELTGEVAVLTSGAGLAMATADLLERLEAPARCIVDLGGTALGDARALGDVLAAIGALQPAVTVVNCFLQLGSCLEIAGALLEARERLGASCVVRLAGNEGAPARKRMKAAGLPVYAELDLACLAAAELAVGSRV